MKRKAPDADSESKAAGAESASFDYKRAKTDMENMVGELNAATAKVSSKVEGWLPSGVWVSTGDIYTMCTGRGTFAGAEQKEEAFVQLLQAGR